MAAHEDKRVTNKTLPIGYRIEHKKLSWQEPLQYHVYHDSVAGNPVTSSFDESTAIDRAIEHSEKLKLKLDEEKANQNVTKEQLKSPKKWGFTKDKESGFAWPSSGVEPWIEIHNSESKTGFTVEEDNPGGNGGAEFGGIFTGDGMDHAARIPHLVIIDPEFHATHSDISHGRDVNGNKLPWSKIDKILKKIAPKLNKSEREDLFDYLDESKMVNFLNAEDNDSNKLQRYFGHDDPGNAAWECQRMRGQLAFALGYKSVSMEDETGISTLVAPGHHTYPIPNGTSKSEADQLAYKAWKKWSDQRASKPTITKSLPIIRVVRRLS